MAAGGPAAVNETRDDDLATRLLDTLRRRLNRPSLGYDKPPRQVLGGFESLIYGFTLEEAPPEFQGPLILRLIRRLEEPTRARREALVQNTVLELGFPAPRVMLAVDSREELGGAFLIMEKLAGTTMVPDFEGLGQGRSRGDLLRLVLRAPQMLRSMFTLMAQTHVRLHQLPGKALFAAFEREGLDSRLITLDGRLETMLSKTNSGASAELRPAVVWLRDHQPSEPKTLAICHCDFQPFNILIADNVVTGVVDWVNVTVGEPMLDLGASTGSFMSVPFHIPAPFKQLAYSFMRVARRAYVKEYDRLNPQPLERLRYYEAHRCVGEMVWLADRVSRGDVKLGAYQSAEGIRRLTGYLRKLTGISVSFPFKL